MGFGEEGELSRVVVGWWLRRREWWWLLALIGIGKCRRLSIWVFERGERREGLSLRAWRELKVRSWKLEASSLSFAAVGQWLWDPDWGLIGGGDDMVSTPCAHFGGGRNKWDLGRWICLPKSHNLQWPTATVQSFSLSFLFFLFLDVNLLIWFDLDLITKLFIMICSIWFYVFSLID